MSPDDHTGPDGWMDFHVGTVVRELGQVRGGLEKIAPGLEPCREPWASLPTSPMASPQTSPMSG